MNNEEERYYELGKSLKNAKEKGGCKGWTVFIIILIVVILLIIASHMQF